MLVINEAFTSNAGSLTTVNGSGLQYSGGNVYFYNTTSPSDHVLLYGTNGVDGTVELQFYTPIDGTISSEMHLIYRLDDPTHYYYLKIYNNISGGSIDFSHWIRSSGSHNNLPTMTNASIIRNAGDLFKIRLIYNSSKLSQVVIENVTQSYKETLSNLTITPYTYTTANKVGFAFVPSTDTENSGNSDGSMYFKVDYLKAYDNGVFYPVIPSGLLTLGSTFQVNKVTLGGRATGGLSLGSQSICTYHKNSDLHLDKNYLFYYESFDSRIGPFTESNPSSGGYSYTGGQLIRSTTSNLDDILYVPCDRNPKIYLNFVCPNTGYVATGSITPLTLVYRYKDSDEYKRVYIIYNNSLSGTTVTTQHSTQNGPDAIGYGSGMLSLPANPSDNFEAVLTVRKNNLYFYIKNITQNQQATSKIDFGVDIADNYFSDQINVGFTFDSNQTFSTKNGTPGATSFKLNAFSAEPLPYEVVDMKYTSTGSVSLGGSPSVKVRYKNYQPVGSLTLSGIQLVKSTNFHNRWTGTLTLGGASLSKTPNRAFTSSSGLSLTGIAGSSTTLNSPDYDIKFYTSPLLVFGITLPTQSFSYICDGSGVYLNGSSLLKPKYFFKNNLASGGVILGGDSIEKPGYKYRPSSGLILGGTSIAIIKDYKYVSTGALILGGTILVNKLRYKYVNSGSLILSGNSRITSSYKYTPVGGLTLGGTTTVTRSYYKYKYTPNSGLTLGGTTTVTRSYYKYKYTPNSGLTLGGTSNQKYSIRLSTSATGGLILGGTSNQKYSIRLRTSGAGGLILGGTSNQKYSIRLRTTNSGSLTLLGKSKTNNRKESRNSGLDPSGLSTNELIPIRIKKEDLYVNWKYENEVIIPKFVDNSN